MGEFVVKNCTRPTDPQSIDFFRGAAPNLKIMKISKFYFGPGSPKNRFLRFFRNFFTKKWAGNLGITSETTWESRVKRPGCQTSS